MISTTKKRKKEKKKKKEKNVTTFGGHHWCAAACRCSGTMLGVHVGITLGSGLLYRLCAVPLHKQHYPFFYFFLFLAHGFERFSQLSLLQNNNKNKKKYTTHTHSSPLCSSPFSFLSSFFLSPAHSHFAVTTSKHATLQDTNQTLQVVLFRTS